MSRYEELRRRQAADLVSAMPDFIARLDWERGEIDAHRQRALRRLVRVAKDCSPWWRERLRGIDPNEVTEADLVGIPPMTRRDLVDHWDDIVIHPSLRLEQVEARLDQAKDDACVLDTFHAVASGGSSGPRGIFVYDWDGWIASFAGCIRWRLRNRARVLERPWPSMALVASERCTHIGCALLQTFQLGRIARLPARLPLDELVGRLNQVQPHVLMGYPSVIHFLAREARRGSLRIRPRVVHCSGEPLTREAREEIEAAWRCRVDNGWSASEATPLAESCGVSGRMHLNDDLVIVEPVDLFGRRVLPGSSSSKVYLTNLFNLALPLIRYELTDRVVLSTRSCPCGSAHTGVDDVRGRLDEHFVYPDGVVVDPEEIDSVLSSEKSVFQYQVVQTDDGAEVRVRCDESLHLRAVGHRVASALSKRGLPHPAVSVHRVEVIERGPAGKLRRFVPRSR